MLETCHCAVSVEEGVVVMVPKKKCRGICETDNMVYPYCQLSIR